MKYFADRNTYGGGVFIAVRDSIVASPQPNLSSHTEMIWIKLQLTNSKSLLIGAFYRPPDSGGDVLDQLQFSLMKLQQTCSGNTLPSILFGGDFNLPSIQWSSNSLRTPPQYREGRNNKMIDIANDNSLMQHVQEPTRGNNIMDLLFSTNPDLVQNVALASGMRNHDIVLADINTKLKANKKKPRMVFFYKR